MSSHKLQRSPRSYRCSSLLVGLLTMLVFKSAAGQTNRPEIVAECGTTATEDCIIRKFKDTPEASVIRGRIVFSSYCTLCHGTEGKGDGRAARIHTPRPANLTLSRVPRAYVELIIRRGGEAIGRYKGMPTWDEQLTNEQIGDVVNYLMTIRTPPN